MRRLASAKAKRKGAGGVTVLRAWVVLQRQKRRRVRGGVQEVVPTTTIAVNGAGDAQCNGHYNWTAEGQWSGPSGHLIVENVGGQRAVLMNGSFASRYKLPIGEAFPMGAWVAVQEGYLPVPAFLYVAPVPGAPMMMAAGFVGIGTVGIQFGAGSGGGAMDRLHLERKPTLAADEAYAEIAVISAAAVWFVDDVSSEAGGDDFSYRARASNSSGYSAYSEVVSTASGGLLGQGGEGVGGQGGEALAGQGGGD